MESRRDSAVSKRRSQYDIHGQPDVAARRHERFHRPPQCGRWVPQKSAALLSGNFDPNRDTMFNPKAWKDPAPWTFGNGPRTYGNLRQFPYFNEDISIIKGTHLNELVRVDLRVDFLNVFNRTVFGLSTGGDQYGSVYADALAGGPGRIISQSNYPREIQFGLRISY